MNIYIYMHISFFEMHHLMYQYWRGQSLNLKKKKKKAFEHGISLIFLCEYIYASLRCIISCACTEERPKSELKGSAGKHSLIYIYIFFWDVSSFQQVCCRCICWHVVYIAVTSTECMYIMYTWTYLYHRYVHFQCVCIYVCVLVGVHVCVLVAERSGGKPVWWSV